MAEIRLLIVPYELGRLRRGVGCGPEHLLEKGAKEALGSVGGKVREELVVLEEGYAEQTGVGEVDACFELIQLVSRAVASARADGAFPVILSGSCFAGVGVVAGLEERSPGVVWFDAHSDFNEPSSTLEGYFDGMGLSVMTGGAWQARRGQVEGGGVVAETAVVLAGARDFDEPERARLEGSAIRHLSPADLADQHALLEAVEGMEPQPSGVYLHLDLDVLDADEARVNVFSAPDGLGGAALADMLDALMRSLPVRAVSLTAYDPGFDRDDRVPPIALRLLERIGAHAG